MNDPDEKFVERFADALAQSGWPRMSARIFATLMMTSNGSRTAGELSARLGVGPSAISNGAKMLRNLRLVDVTRHSDRQIRYEVRPEAWMEAVANQEGQLSALEAILTESATASAQPQAAARLCETADFFAFLRAELPTIVTRWRDTRRPPEQEA